MLENLLECIAVGLIGGFAYAFTGLLKSITKEGFSGKKFGRTLLLGIIAGITLALSGQEVSVDAISVAIAAGEVALLEQLLIAIFRAVVKSGKTA
ncbi:MAG: hypothetical protein QXW39_07395 [Candidatus Bathyarchaeia archaeon]